MLDRTTPPPIRQLSEFSITRPDRRTMKNGMPLNIIHAGTEDVVPVSYTHLTLPTKA